MRRIALDTQGMTDEELKGLASFLATQVDGMDDESVAYGAYVATAVPGDKQHILGTLPARLLMSYRKRLVGWFEHALKSRARRGGGGPGIKKINDGLAAFVAAIPGAIMTGTPVNVSDFVPPNEYLVPEKLNQVGLRIQRAVRDEALKAGVLTTGQGPASVQKVVKTPRPPIGLDLLHNNKTDTWWIGNSARAYPVRDKLKEMGFRWNPTEKVWEVRKLTPDIQKEFGISFVTVTPSENILNWFNGWIAANIDRFSKIFTDFARSEQSSYSIKFSIVSNKVDVSFVRDTDSIAKVIAELRYRYLNKHGREPWLEVMDRFIDLVEATSPNKVQGLIDRINNLQHSNGLFMEHFPLDVQAWYEGFLNAKYHTPNADELAKNIPDWDLRGLLVAVAAPQHGIRPADFNYLPSRDYKRMHKELVLADTDATTVKMYRDLIGKKKFEEAKRLEQELAAAGFRINWRAEAYPAYKGAPDIERTSPEVQKKLEVLRALDTQREAILSTKVDSPAKEKEMVDKGVAWTLDQSRAVQELAAALNKAREEQRVRDLDPARWEMVNRPGDFKKQFPNAYPGSNSDLAEFVARYAALGFAPGLH